MNNATFINNAGKNKKFLSTTLLNGLSLITLLAVFSANPARGVEEEREINVFSFEGGGVRAAYIELTFLDEVMKEAEVISGRCVHVNEIVDFWTASSMGGIIAAALTLPKSTEGDKSTWVPKYTPSQLLKKIEYSFPTIFQYAWSFFGLLGPKYKSNGPEEVASDIYGDIAFNKALTPTVITSFDLNRGKTVLFKSYDQTQEVLTKDIAIGTGSGPTYWAPHHMTAKINGQPVDYRLVDGGITANDPAQIGAMMAQGFFGAKKPYRFVSVAAGEIARSYPSEKYDDAGLITWMLSIKDLFFTGQRTLSDEVMGGTYGDHYSKWSPKITINDPSIDNYAPEVLQYYKNATLKMIEDRNPEFKDLVKILLVNKGIPVQDPFADQC